MEKSIFTIKDLAIYTGWSKSYIYKKTSDGTLKFSKPLGKTIFFSKEWVDKFLLSNLTATTKELESKAATFVTLKKGGAK
ncbi:MAG: excisionase family DNA-binding protein [Bacteroidetes bacterium]|nr:excisionase family DNA-binding protein [Bacteroidota bacterium]